MDRNIQVLIGMAAIAALALAAFTLYRWVCRRRIRRIEQSVREYLVSRYGNQPGRLAVNCSDDPLWPILVTFDGPNPGSRHSLQFACPGSISTFSLLSEEEARS